MLCNSLSTFVSVFKIKRSRGASAARSRGVLIVKILNKCILIISGYNLVEIIGKNHDIYL